MTGKRKCSKPTVRIYFFTGITSGHDHVRADLD